MNIIQFSFPSSGTMIIAKLVLELSKNKLFLDEANRFIHKFLPIVMNDVSNLKNIDFVRLGSFDLYDEGNTATCGVYAYDKNGNMEYAKQIEITDFTKNIFLENSDLYAVTHARPQKLLDNSFCETKKIYVLRDFRDAYHSHVRSIDKQEGSSKYLSQISANREFAIVARYFDIEMFINFLYGWRFHVEEYLKNQDDYILIKYEDLIANPNNTILKLVKTLSLEVEDIYVSQATEKHLFKDVWLFGKQDVKFSHFNNGGAGDWRTYFSPTMRRITSEVVGDLLVKCGYENDLEWWQLDSAKVSSTQTLIERKFLDSSQNIRVGQSLTPLNEILSYIDELEQKVVFFGASEYLKLLIERIQNREKIKFIVDEQLEKVDTKIFGIEIFDITNLIFRYDEYDLICISVNDIYLDSIYSKLSVIGIPRNKIVNVFSQKAFIELKAHS